MLSQILVPLDGSELADRILSLLERLPRPHDVQPLLLRVLEPGDDGAAVAGPAIRHLAERVARLEEVNIHALPLATQGQAADRVVELAGLLEPSLVAMATSGAGEAPGRGSVAAHVLERCPVPLLLANPRALPLDPGLGFARILVPLDGSETSARVLPLVSGIAQHHDSEVVLLLVDPSGTLGHEISAEELEPYRQRLVHSGVKKVSVQGRVGEEAAEIVAAAEEWGADLMAMTSHSRPDPHKRWFGSVAQDVANACPCPLLLVRI